MPAKSKITDEYVEIVKALYLTGDYGQFQPDPGNLSIQWKKITEELSFKFPELKFSSDLLRKSSKIITLLTGLRHGKVIAMKTVLPEDYRAQNKVIVEQQKTIVKMQSDQNIFLRTMNTQILKLKPYKWNINPPTKIRKKHNSQAHLILSDVHDGVEIKSRDTMGRSIYTPDICAERYNILGDKILSYQEDDREIHGLNTLIIACLGDMMEGTNVYPGQSFTVVMNELEQWIHQIELNCKLIIKMCGSFNMVEMFCIPGNHGWGSTKKGNSPTFSADSFLYAALYMLLSDIPNLNMYISDCPRMMVQHRGKNFVYSHGNESRSSLGIPFYGLQRTAQRLPKLLTELVNYYIHGHFHTASNLNDGEIIGNGCFPGGSDLSVNKMSVSSRPSQKLFYLNIKGEIFHESNIYLADEPKLEMDDNGIYTPCNSFIDTIDNVIDSVAKRGK